MKALVLLSGGQDSTTCLFWALKKFDEVYAIGFNYGQRHKLENELAAKIAQDAKVPFYLAEITTLNEVSPNALTEKDIKVEDTVKEGTPPNTLVEGRNLLFLTYAGIYAKSKNIHNIVMGVSQTDFSNYPDCRLDFVKATENALTLATNFKFEVHTPLMFKTKAETWEMADTLGVLDLVRNETLTCYNGIIADGCGECPACKLRKIGLDKYIGILEK